MTISAEKCREAIRRRKKKKTCLFHHKNTQIMIHMQNETLQGKETSIKTLKVAVMDVTWVNDVLNNNK